MKRSLVIGGSILAVFLTVSLSFNVVLASNGNSEFIYEKSKISNSFKTPNIFHKSIKRDNGMVLNYYPGEFLYYLLLRLILIIVWIFVNW